MDRIVRSMACRWEAADHEAQNQTQADPIKRSRPVSIDSTQGFGDVVLDVRKRTITVERNDRFEDYSNDDL